MKLLRKFKKFWLVVFAVFFLMSYFLNKDTARFCLGKYCAEGYAQEHFLFSLMLGVLCSFITFVVIWLWSDGLVLINKTVIKTAKELLAKLIKKRFS